MLSSFGLSIKTKINDGVEKEISWEFAEKYRKMLNILKSVYDKVDKIAGAKEAREAAKTLPPNLTHRRSLMSLSLLPPAPSVGIGWKNVIYENKVGLELKGKVKCDPLIGGELNIDLLALGSKIPIYGKLIKALDIGTWVIEKLSMGTLDIDYHLNLKFYANLALKETFLSYTSIKPKGERFNGDIVVSGTLGGELDIGLNIIAKLKKVEKGPEFVFDTDINADCHFTIELSPNFDKKSKLEIDTSFSGLIVKIQYRAGIKKGNKDVPTKEFDPFTLIPSLKGDKVVLNIE